MDGQIEERVQQCPTCQVHRHAPRSHLYTHRVTWPSVGAATFGFCLTYRFAEAGNAYVNSSCSNRKRGAVGSAQDSHCVRSFPVANSLAITTCPDLPWVVWENLSLEFDYGRLWNKARCMGWLFRSACRCCSSLLDIVSMVELTVVHCMR